MYACVCTNHVALVDFLWLNTHFFFLFQVILYGRDLRIVSYADKSTEAALVPQAVRNGPIVLNEAWVYVPESLDQFVMFLRHWFPTIFE